MKILFMASVREFSLLLIFLFDSGAQPASQLMGSMSGGGVGWGDGGRYVPEKRFRLVNLITRLHLLSRLRMNVAVLSSLHALMARMRSIESFCSISDIYCHLMSWPCRNL